MDGIVSQNHSSSKRPNVTIISRTYSGDMSRFKTILYPSIKLFLSPTRYEFKVVLDADNQTDRDVGD